MNSKVNGEKKEKDGLEKIKCNPHNFIVTGWMTKGGNQKATQMRCSTCLTPKCLEELESKEWVDSQAV